MTDEVPDYFADLSPREIDWIVRQVEAAPRMSPALRREMAELVARQQIALRGRGPGETGRGSDRE